MKLKKYDYIKGILCTLLCVIFILVLISYKNFDISVPLSYMGGDETSYMSEIKMLLDDNSILESDKIAAPFGTDRRGNLSYYLFNDVHIISYIFVKITHNVGMAVNLTLLLLFIINAMSALLVMMSRKINWFISALGAIVFSFLSYVFLRNTEHIMLSAMYTIPICILICIWIWEDASFLVFNKGFLRYKRNWIFLFFCILIVNSGIGYYMFFTCLFILFTGVSATIFNKSFDKLKKAFLSLGGIVIAFLITVLPFVVYKLSTTDSGSVNVRTLGDVEVYCLKIARLFIPSFGSGITKIDNIFNEYAQVAVCQTETTEYIGLFGTIGFVLLLFVFLCDRDKITKCNELFLMSQMIIVALLYATIGGFEVFTFLFITNMARCTNRISIYIAFICIFSLCLLYSNVIDVIKKKGYKVIAITSCIIIVTVSLKLQIPGDGFNNLESQSTYDEMVQFVAEIESTVSEDAMIFQLPIQYYPTGSFINNMYPNALFMPHIVSDNLRWSYGALTYEKSHEWNIKIASLECADMVDSLCYAGFEGIYIDSAAYTEDELFTLEQQMDEKVGGNNKFKSNSNRWIFYNLNDHTKELKESLNTDEWKERRKETLN